MTQQSKSIRCRNCGHDNLESAQKCIVCDTPLTYTSRFQTKKNVPTGLLDPTHEEIVDALPDAKDVQVPTPPSEAATTAQRRQTGTKCPDCGFVNRVGDFFCQDCGRNISSEPPMDSPADITQQMKALTASDIRAAIEQQKAEEAQKKAEEEQQDKPAPTPPPVPMPPSVPIPQQKPPPVVTTILQSVGDETIPDGCFQFTSDMFLRFTEIETGRYAEVTPIHNKPLLIGRSHKSLPMQPDVDLTPFLSEQHGVSRRHALMRWRDLRLEMQDLNSTNGTSINGFRFHPKETHEIRNGDVLTLGRITVKVAFMSKETDRANSVTDRLDNK